MWVKLVDFWNKSRGTIGESLESRMGGSVSVPLIFLPRRSSIPLPIARSCSGCESPPVDPGSSPGNTAIDSCCRSAATRGHAGSSRSARTLLDRGEPDIVKQIARRNGAAIGQPSIIVPPRMGGTFVICIQCKKIHSIKYHAAGWEVFFFFAQTGI